MNKSTNIAHVAALDAARFGLSTIPPRMDGSKAPIANWKQYQQHTASTDEIDSWYSNGQTGVGLVCGNVSGGLECLDFDNHDVWTLYKEAAKQAGLWNLLSRVAMGYAESTPNGFHLLYTCSAITGNTKLAQAENKDTLIETRGEGGFIIVAPSHGKVNPFGDYILKAGGFESIEAITTDERKLLHELARSFDEVERYVDQRQQAVVDGDRPGDEYVRSTTWNDVLEPTGWVKVFQRGDTDYWRRPGKNEGISATTNHNGSDLLYVFSSSTVFDSERGYNRFSAYTLINFNGDFKASAKALGGNNSSVPYTAETWPEPAPLPDELHHVPDMDYKLLPASIRDWVFDISDRQGCPPDYVAVTALVHLGAIIGRKVAIRPKLHGDTWTVTPNLWGACIGPPSIMKSPAITEARKPFKAVEKRLLEDAEREQKPLREDFQGMQLEYEAELGAVKLEWKILKTGKIPKGGRLPSRMELNERSAALSGMKAELDELEARAYAERRLEVQDPTPEALQVVLQNNPNGVLYFNDELTSWLESLGKSGREGSRQMHLEMWDGTQAGSVDRIGRGHIEYNKIESIFGSIQPGPLGVMVDKALSPDKANDGLIQRFQLMVWRSKFESDPKDKKPNLNAAYKAEKTFLRAYEITPADLGCHDGEIPYLQFTPNAYAIWWPWYMDLRNRAKDIPEAQASHLMKYSSMVPALALIDHVADSGHGDVGLESIQRAIGLADWLWQHAIRVYTASGYAKRSRLRQLATRIERNRLGKEFTLRDIKQSGWTGIVKDDARVLLDELVLMDWLSHSQVTGEHGGRPSDVYTVNPKVYLKSHGRNLPSKPSKPIDNGGYEGYEAKNPTEEINRNDISIERTKKPYCIDQGYF